MRAENSQASPESRHTDNADVIIAAILVLLLITFTLTPYIPGLRDLPRWIPLHRLVWKDYYKKYGRASS